MPRMFDHENLKVYQASLQFIAWLQEILNRVPKTLAIHDQLDRASTSIPLNIAEGNGKFTERDRCKSFDIERGSSLECAACLDVLVVQSILTQGEIQQGKELLIQIVSMLVGLIKSNSTGRVYETPMPYGDDTL